MKQDEFTRSLEDEIEEFKKQKERVREIIGQIGGKPTFMKKMANVIFVVLVAICFILSLITKGRTELLMLELIILLVSAKFIYFLFLQSRVIHFQFWILSSIEWRINEVVNKLQNLYKKLEKIC
jgi:cell shape-determining protein MreC